ncbi:hypothetical protein ASG43_21490 [Aureimonas sp. Leaf454]|uniref:AAA family ATPase n=1 Tax=Aureimonas sp. Leaf454 TaxID=1736381 RepID=UPI0006FEC6B9|nr:AAA family ATPase [Aureimonas sp. Leaf454]KQT51181.1 hypothetical protein ASG43_21490 [Aureimonas sp. Leaf454]
MKDLTYAQLLDRAQVPELIDLECSHDHDWRALIMGLGGPEGGEDRANLVWALEQRGQCEPGDTIHDPGPHYSVVATVVANGGSPVDETRLMYACALAGWRTAQVELSAAFSALAVDQRHVAYEFGRRVSRGEPTPQLVRRLEYRAESCAGSALGWGAVASGRRAFGLPEDAGLDIQARAIGTDLLAMLGWRNRKLPEEPTVGEEHSDGEEVLPTSVAPASVRVVERIVGSTSFAKNAMTGVADLVGRDIPLVIAPDGEDLRRIRREIAAVFPHAVPALDALLSDVAPGRAIRLRPTMLLGPPGTGKSRLARLLLARLGVPYAALDAAAMADQAIVGSPRRWRHSYPSVPISLVLEHDVANPGVILDEIEKAGRTEAGSVHDPLLGLLETGTAKAWRDQFLDAAADLSHLTWLFTANSTNGVPAPLLSRIRVLRVPAPASEHVPTLARSLLREVLEDRLVDHRLEADLAPFELETIGTAFAGVRNGSLRDLKRIVEAALDARSMPPKH